MNKLYNRLRWCFCVTLLLCGGFFSHAQTIKRQSISSIGSSHSSSDLVIRQSVGQPYFTSTHSEDDLGYRPGFQQPTTLKISTEDLESTFDFKIATYPNPVASSLVLESSETLKGAKIQIVDLKGNLIWSQEFDEFRRSNIEVNNWKEGIYFLSLSDDRAKKHTAKIIVNK